MKNSLRGFILLLACAFIWGFGFVAQSAGMDNMEPYGFTTVRMFLAFVFLFPCAKYVDYKNRKVGEIKDRARKKNELKDTIIAGAACGFFIFCGSNLQQFALINTTAGKAGFISALYIVVVPLLGLFFNHKVSIFNWISVILAIIGLYFLCLTENYNISIEDTYLLLGAIFWGFHIITVAHFTHKVSAVKLSAAQMVSGGIMSLIMTVIKEDFTISGMSAAMPALLFSGVLSSGIAFTLQILGQRYSKPTTASILMSTESFFAVLGGFLVLHEVFSNREIVGSLILFAAVLISQIPAKSKT